MESHLTITEVARRTGLSAHTLRYYERAGLIAPISRGPGGQRRYAAADLEWIGFLLRLRETRMPIGQMQAFARLRSQGNSTAPERRQVLERHLANVLATVEAMQHAAAVLRDKIAHYRGIEACVLTAFNASERNPHDPDPHSSTGPLPAGPGQTARSRR